MDNIVSSNLPYMPNEEDYIAKASFSQQRMWFLYQTFEKKEAYHIPFVIKLPNGFRKDYLEKAFNDIILRHDIFRTTFEIDNEELIQVVHPYSYYTIETVEYLDINNKNMESKVFDFSNIEFDLENGPCFRAKIVNLSDGQNMMILVFHHIIFDGHSLKIFYKELLKRYEALLNGQLPPFCELKIQYGDYSEWQNEWITSAGAQRQMEFWKSKTNIIGTEIKLPTTLEKKSNDGVVKRKISNEILDDIDLFCRGIGITRYMFMLTSFIVLIQRYTRNENMVVGMPIANRDKIETEELIGLLLNTTVLHVPIDEGMTFEEILEIVKNNLIEVYDNSSIPFEKIMEYSKNKELSKENPFDIFINYEMTDIESNQEFELIQFDETNAKFPISFYIEDGLNDMRLRISYQSNKYSASMIGILLQQLENLIKDFLKNPTMKIYEYHLVSEEDNNVLPDPTVKLQEPCQKLLPQLLYETFKQNSDFIAISQGDKQWTYRTLYENVSFIQTEIAASKIKKGTAIAVFGERSMEYICTMLAIMCSGMVFVPIDKKLPIKKREEIFSQIGIKNIFYTNDSCKISGETFHHEFTANEIIQRNSPNKNLNKGKLEYLDINPEDAAYIYFTSGTTGKPKGIIGKHKSLAHFLNWQVTEFNVKRGDRAAQLTNVSFDVFLRDSLLPLVCGGELCIPDDINNMSGEYLINWLIENKITIIHSVPSLANSWIPKNEIYDLQDLRLIFFAGEPLTNQIIYTLRNNLSYSGEIINFYGPSETTLAKSFYKVPIVTKHAVQPIGFPIKNTQLLILKNKQLMCGIGEIGEIVIRTPFLTKGYIDKEAFKLNPLSSHEDDYIYYTGDIGRYSQDGSIEILGRIDDQIKINGIRVELAEITNIIIGHPVIDEAIVIKKEKKSRNYLVAYFVKNSNVSISEIKDYCRKYLSTSLIPSIFIELDKLPLNKNGKIDKSLLPEPKEIDSNTQNYIPPVTFNENKLCNILESILSVNDIGLNDDFFELGGHSLLITQLISRISNEFNVKPTMKDIFNNSRISEMILIIESLLKQPENQLNSDIDINEYYEMDMNFDIEELSIEEMELLLEQMLLRED
ncbi:condensation domain-containing protein [Lysinibacillus sp. CNPSo 3705]|uniref:non-ribosomal peptide synthetase n=1 Tax=Lysinibacillus sp. CNPSo 3705 TaxID=3028148 RepID=UPI002363FD24|nr:condensation domain-containing protein [Lysinibacillus sp. CNPSo 3705]MDD1505459.1 condensation domain-containing protein [Lysinibacillus sp. CNPSo 3705]